MVDCIFCAIVANQIPSTVVAENDQALAIMDINPANDGHVLVLPRSHATDLFDLDPEVGGAIMPLCIQVANAIKTSLRPEGLNLIQASGEAAGQEIFHTHFHLVPRWHDDGKLGWWPMHPGDAARIQEVAGLIRAAL